MKKSVFRANYNTLKELKENMKAKQVDIEEEVDKEVDKLKGKKKGKKVDLDD